MGWTEGDPHDRAGCLTAVLLNFVVLLALAVILVLVLR